MMPFVRPAAVLLFVLTPAMAACEPSLGSELAQSRPTSRKAPQAQPASISKRIQTATFAGGCFWCMEPPFEGLYGVLSVVSGYSGGKEKDPTYEQVSSGRTGHTESVQIRFDSRRISFSQLLDLYWRSFDPTDGGGQFGDRGSQYRPAIFVHDARQRELAFASKKALAASGRFKKPIAVEITDFTSFWPAESYHQDYYKKNHTHYKNYRKGSGRSGFLIRTWGEDVPTMTKKNDAFVKPSKAELEDELDDLQYKVTQQNGTEAPFKNLYWDNKRAGIYVDIVSGEPLFSSKDKYESGSGWPSFVRPLSKENVRELVDKTHGMVRTEVRSRTGDSHLGHLFDDGPAPTGMRYCINSAALRFIPAEDLVKEGYADYVRLFADADGKSEGKSDDEGATSKPTSRPASRKHED